MPKLPDAVLDAAIARQRAARNAQKRIAKRVDALILREWQRATRSGRPISEKRLVELEAKVSNFLKVELRAQAATDYRAWRRVVAKVEGGRPSREIRALSPDLVNRVVTQRTVKGRRWGERLREKRLTARHVRAAKRKHRLRSDQARELVDRVNRLRASARAIANTEGNRVNLAMAQKAARDVFPGKVFGWRYTHVNVNEPAPPARAHHQARDGRVYKVGQRRPVLPDGYGCRCVWIPVLVGRGRVARRD